MNLRAEQESEAAQDAAACAPAEHDPDCDCVCNQPNPFVESFRTGKLDIPSAVAGQVAIDTAARQENEGSVAALPIGPASMFYVSTALYAAVSHPGFSHNDQAVKVANFLGRTFASTLMHHVVPEVRITGQIAMACWIAYANGELLDSGIAADEAPIVISPGDVARAADEAELGRMLAARAVRMSLRGLAANLAEAAATLGSHVDMIADAIGETDPGVAVRRAAAAESVNVPVDAPSNWFAPPVERPTDGPFPESGTPVADSVSADLGATQMIPVIPELIADPLWGTPVQIQESPDHPAFVTKLEQGTKFVSVDCPRCEFSAWVPYANAEDLRIQYHNALGRHFLDSEECALQVGGGS